MIENFIRTYPNKASSEFCSSVINAFEEIISNPELKSYTMDNSKQFVNGDLGRKDMALFLEEPIFNKANLCSEMLYLLQDCLTNYIEEFPHLKNIGLSNRCNLKIQKTSPRGGYHQWHYETNAGQDSWTRE